MYIAETSYVRVRNCQIRNQELQFPVSAEHLWQGPASVSGDAALSVPTAPSQPSPDKPHRVPTPRCRSYYVLPVILCPCLPLICAAHSPVPVHHRTVPITPCRGFPTVPTSHSCCPPWRRGCACFVLLLVFSLLCCMMYGRACLIHYYACLPTKECCQRSVM